MYTYVRGHSTYNVVTVTVLQLYVVLGLAMIICRLVLITKQPNHLASSCLIRPFVPLLLIIK
jgi:hypothetical protein